MIVDLQDHLFVGVAHPDDGLVHINPGIPEPRCERVPEIMGADGDPDGLAVIRPCAGKDLFGHGLARPGQDVTVTVHFREKHQDKVRGGNGADTGGGLWVRYARLIADVVHSAADGQGIARNVPCLKSKKFTTAKAAIEHDQGGKPESVRGCLYGGAFLGHDCAVRTLGAFGRVDGLSAGGVFLHVPGIGCTVEDFCQEDTRLVDV